MIKMSTGKRLAKRSIIGTRVVALCDDGLFQSGVIHAVKTSRDDETSRYSVRFDSSRRIGVYKDCDLIGPGFQSVQSATLQTGQKVFLTYNGREVSGVVQHHNTNNDDVIVIISPPGHDVSILLLLYSFVQF